MPSITNLTIADGQTTPANKTFTPYTAQRGTEPAVWLNKEASTMVGARRITCLVREKATSGYKVSLKIEDPVLAALAPGCCVDANTPKISYIDLVNIEFSLPAGATIANRKDILAYAKNLLGTAVATSAVVDLEPQF